MQEAGVGFDVSADGTSVLTPVGQTSQARMILAQKGLPHSGNVGDELYDSQFGRVLRRRRRNQTLAPRLPLWDAGRTHAHPPYGQHGDSIPVPSG